MIVHEQEKYGWEYLFLEANIDAVETSGHLEIHEDRTAYFHPDSTRVKLCFSSMARAVSAARCSAPMTADWNEKVEDDYNRRNKGKN